MSAEEIKYIRSDGPVVYIMDNQDQQLAGGQSLKFYTDLLVEASFSSEQSILVNLKKVRYIDAANQEIELHCGKRITMSRNGLKMLKEHIKNRQYKW
ncbi:MAG: LytTR family transcriptional regulator [Saprospiraceae bacterium]|nr:LytTR family transcriptional regulator [Saprospiraceae bacterium]